MAEELNDSKSWYTKYRPYDMEGYSGPKIKKMVAGRFRNKADMPHVLLVSGPRGCGKTTLMRILTKYYQCENPNEDGTPCEKCAACLDINENVIYGADEGIQVEGIREVPVNVANGKEALQEIINTAKIEPMYSNYNILMLDEFHEASTAAQNSLLKDLEDIKPYMVVMIATTNPEKIIEPIVSRCQMKVEVRRQSVSDMANRLEEIALAEKVTATRPALENIAKKCGCIPRECINLLEAISKTYGKQVNNENLTDYLDEISTDLYIKFFKSANDSLEELLYTINELKEKDIKISDYINGLMEFIIDAMYIRNGINLDSYTPGLVSDIAKLFETYQINEFDMLLQVLQDAISKLNTANDNGNEALLILTGLRIAKIQLLASGLDNFRDEAVIENKTSMIEHTKMLSQENKKITEQQKFSVTPAFAQESFDDAAIIEADSNSLDYLKQLNNLESIPENFDTNNNYNNTDNLKENAEKLTGISEIDDFFNK